MASQKFTLLILSLVPFVYADCIVEDKSTKEHATCVFPFTFNYKDSSGTMVNQTFYGCTRNLDPDDKPWCSTKVDSIGIHQAGHWGHCETNSTDCSNVIVPRVADNVIGKYLEMPNCCFDYAFVFLAVNQRFYSNQSCPCINRNYCPWYKKSLQEVWRSRNKTVKTQFTLMIRGLICDRRKRHIKCCSGNSVNSVINSLTTVKHTTTTPKISNSKSASLISQSIQVSIIDKEYTYDTIC